MRKSYIRVLLVSFLLLMLVFSSSDLVLASTITPPGGSFVVSTKKTTLVPGVVETEIIYNTPDGSKPVSGFLVDINLGSNVNIMAASKNYNEPGVQTVREMAKAAVDKTGRNVVAAINADLNWTGTGISNGPLIIDGTIYTDKPDTFFGITKDNQAIIGDSNKYSQVKGDLQQAIRGMGWLVRDGNVVNTSLGLAPRTAVGIKADGSVFFYVVEGRIFPRSNGVSTKELAEVMKSYGAVNALNLDGGGSTTYLAKTEGETSLELRNIPSDNGVERESISSLLVYGIVGDGNFHHAVISSEGDIYTPNSVVQLSARGVDNAGGSADLPDTLNWKLKDNKFGSIDKNGKFTSNGSQGEVVVQLVDERNNIVGEGSIEVRLPDEIHFTNEEFSLGFEEENDFGLRLTYEQRPIIFKDGDLTWEFDEILGSVDNNIFTSNPDESVNGIVKVRVNGTDVSKEISLVVGKLPLVIFDFENDAINEKWEASSVNGVGSKISIVNRDSGEPVRFGNQALRMDYNFTTQARNPGGAYAGFTDRPGLEELGVTFELPGAPTGVGMWIYATEEAQGLWLRTGIGVEGTTAFKAFNLTEELVGIDWVGEWKYVEVDLTDFSGPYTILPGQFIRLMVTANSFDGQPLRPVGNIYVDDITVTYGTNIDDVNSPMIDYIRVNDEEVEHGQTLTTNNVTIETAFADHDNKYSTGIDYENINIYVDGINYLDHPAYQLDMTGDKAYLQNVYLTDGTHEIEVILSDNAGNETRQSRFINIDTGSKNKVYLDSSDSVVLGKDYQIELKSDEIDNIDSANLSLRISNTLADYEVEFSEAFEGDVEYLNGVRFLNINAERVNDTQVDYIFRIKSSIASELNENDVATYSVNIGSFEYKVDNTEDHFLKSFSKLPQNLKIAAPLEITSNTILVGQDAIFTVRDFEGNTVEDAEIFSKTESGEELIGATDEEGKYITDIFSQEVTQFTLIAKHGEDISFEFKGQSFEATDETGHAPFNIHFNGVKNPESSKNISWFTNVDAGSQAYIEYALKSDYDADGESALVRKEGSSQEHIFTGSSSAEENRVINVNNTVITGLNSGGQYVYRVGNGETWSDIGNFETGYKDSDSKFLILGDVQTGSYEGFRNDLAKISSNGINYDYAIQVGDLVDDAGVYSHWNEILAAISDSGINNLDMVQVLGNHEYYGDVNGDKAKAIFNMPGDNQNYYSTQYQNVYIGVLNYNMSRNQVTEALEWLVEDANQSNAKWRILVTHQPPYYTNPEGGNEIINELLPQYAEEAGIDFVFSGHDHAYARTKPLIDGLPNEEGVVYVVTGALGEKRYTAVNNPDFNFDLVNDKFKSIYLTVTTDNNKFTIMTREVDTGEIIDTYTKSKHDIGHEHVYYLDGDRLICQDCSYNRPLEGHTGFVRTFDEEIMYFINGDSFKGLLVLGRDKYFFNEETGIAYTGETEVYGLATSFDDDGKYLSGGTGFVKEGNNTLYYLELSKYTGGWIDIDGHRYYFTTSNGYMLTGTTRVAGISYKFADDGKLIGPVDFEFVETEEGTYVLNERGQRLQGWQVIEGNTYYFSTNPHGYMRTGQQYVGGILYDFGLDGKLIGEVKEDPSVGTGFIETEEGTYYLNEAGERLHGWQEIEGDKYYFSTNPHGYMRTGQQYVGGILYDFGQDGKLIGEVKEDPSLGTGFIETEEGTYYITEDGQILHGWQEIDGEKYYFSTNPHGYMRTGKQFVGGILYEFAADGKLIGQVKEDPGTDTGFIETEEGTYYIDAQGEILHGWQEIEGEKYYFSTNPHGYMRTGKQFVGGILYEFAADGKLIGEVKEDPSVGTGFIDSEEGTYYITEDGVRLHGWQEIDGNKYYFSTNPHGYMRTGQQYVGGILYDFGKDGKLIGEVKEDPSLGTGFIETENGSYYVTEEGRRLHGWQEIDGDMYYFSTNPHGYMRTGKSYVGGVEYEFAKDGKLMGQDKEPGRGFVKTVLGTYYINDQDEILHGWHEIDGNTYYFSTNPHGYMRTGETLVGDVLYEFTEEGILVGEVKRNTQALTQEVEEVEVEEIVTEEVEVEEVESQEPQVETEESEEELDQIGEILGEFIETEEGTYFILEDETKLFGWEEVEGERHYFFTEEGLELISNIYIDDLLYEFTEDGELVEKVDLSEEDDITIEREEENYFEDDQGNKLYLWETEDDKYSFSIELDESIEGITISLQEVLVEQ